MNLADIKVDDIVDSSSGLCVSLWFGYCDIRCKGCHNKDLWDLYNYVENDIVVDKLLEAIPNHVLHNLSILGGEPLAYGSNREDCLYIIQKIREKYPKGTIKIYLWTGYVKEDIEKDPIVQEIFKNIDYLIDGPYIEELRTTSEPLIGSTNQRINIM